MNVNFDIEDGVLTPQSQKIQAGMFFYCNDTESVFVVGESSDKASGFLFVSLEDGSVSFDFEDAVTVRDVTMHNYQLMNFSTIVFGK